MGVHTGQALLSVLAVRVSEEAERRERIVLLLEHYIDVEAGLRDVLGTGEHIPLMCRAWRKPVEGYPELDHQLGVMKVRERELYRHLAQTYFHSPRRRVLMCPRCRQVQPSWGSSNFHKHGSKNVAVVPAVVRVTPAWVDQRRVQAAVDWLERNWRGAVFVPDELRVA